MPDLIADAAARLLALMGNQPPWDPRDEEPPLSIGVFDRQALADAAIEAHRRAREGWA